MKPKILFFLHLPPPQHGVTATNTRIIQSGRIQEGFQVQVLPISYNQEIMDTGRFRFKKILEVLRLLGKLSKELIFFRPQLVYFSLVPYGTPFYRDALFALLLKIFRRKALFHLHGVGIDLCIHGPLSRWVYRLIFRKSFVIIQSRLLAPDLEKIKAVIQKIYVVHNAIPLEKQRAAPKPIPTTLAFINVSTLIPSKGQMDILKAASSLARKGASFFKIILIGQTYDTRYEQDLKTFIKKNGLEKFVDFRGALFGTEKEKAIEAADVFLFPSYNESFGLVSIEAMRAGLPVIATHVGSLPEIVEGGCGFLYPPGDIEQLAKYMHLFLENKEKISPMGKKAFETFVRKFTFETFEQKLREVFWDVLRSTPRDASPPPRG